MTDATHFTYKSFSTTDFYVMIEDMTTAKSAFGVTDDHIQLTDFNVIADAMRSDKGWWTQVELEEHLSDEGISKDRIDEFLMDENQPLEQAVAFRILPGD